MDQLARHVNPVSGQQLEFETLDDVLMLFNQRNGENHDQGQQHTFDFDALSPQCDWGMPAPHSGFGLPLPPAVHSYPPTFPLYDERSISGTSDFSTQSSTPTFSSKESDQDNKDKGGKSKKRDKDKANNNSSSTNSNNNNNRGNYRCGRCGQPKVNHVCSFVDAPTASVSIQVSGWLVDLVDGY
jgi:hypothetical protein